MERLIKIFDKIAYGSLMLMLLIVVTSVLGRLVLDLSGGTINLVYPGQIELSKYALLIMVFASLPRAAVHGLVSVELLLGAMPQILRHFLERVWDLLLAAFTAAIGWLFLKRTLTMFERGDYTQDLGIPLYLIYAALTVCCIVISLTGLWLGLKKKYGIDPET
ncbi:MAG: TRAP transporter small permease [Methylocystaceae bacterium]|nr:TRAP transporter small permease [Methylocystaceae bacterium]